MRPRAPYLSVIVPAHQGAGVLPRSLAALRASDLPAETWELIVVDDASSDDTSVVSARYADTVVRLPGKPHGPAYARNRGFEVARGDVVVFIDADVCVHPDTLRLFAQCFVRERDVSAVFGSYDDAPAASGIVSRYRNLLHRYVHLQCAGDAETFWAGCGAIRSAAFAAAGMYDEWHFSRPQIEDIELGHRLRDAGYRIVLRPEIQGKHLKKWSLHDLIATDLKSRGVPWMRLLIQQGAAARNQALNLRTVEKFKTALIGLALLFLGMAIFRLEGRWLLGTLACTLTVVVSSLRLYRYFASVGGILFALATIPLHLLYYVVSGLSVPVGWMLHETVGEPRPAPTVQAFAEMGTSQWPPVPARRKTDSWQLPSVEP